MMEFSEMTQPCDRLSLNETGEAVPQNELHHAPISAQHRHNEIELN